MARVNVDSFFFVDKRVNKLAALCDEEIVTTRGRLLQVYYDCYMHRTPVRTKDEVDLQSEWTGEGSFAELMVQAGLASETEAGNYWIKGVEDRIQYLFDQQEKGKKGGQVSAERRKLRLANAQADAQPNAKPMVNQNQAPAETCSSKFNPLPLPPSPPPDINTEKEKKPISISQSPTASVGKEEQDQCENDWLETLKHFGVERKTLLTGERSQIYNAIKQHGVVAVRYAITGMRYEKKTETYNPADYLRLSRAFDPNNFEMFINLASREKTKQEKQKEAQERAEAIKAHIGGLS